MIEMLNMDCTEYMAGCRDGEFDLAIVDPPYGINVNMNAGRKKSNASPKRDKKQWDDKTPDGKYFSELFRVSKNQIIWGGNYFGQLWLRSEYNKGFIIWDKNQPETLNNFSMAEMAWSSLDKPSKIFRFSVRKNRNKIHPTQKPVELYEWLLKMYANQGDKILDTHLGSGTIAIACYNAGLSLTACEISETYYLKALDKIKEVVPESAIHTNDLDAFSLTFPEQTKSKNGLYKQYQEQVEQLRLFKEERAKYYESMR